MPLLTPPPKTALLFVTMNASSNKVRNGFETIALAGVRVTPGLMLVAGTGAHTYHDDLGVELSAPEGITLWAEPVGLGRSDDARWYRRKALAGFAGDVREVRLRDLARFGVSVRRTN